MKKYTGTFIQAADLLFKQGAAQASYSANNSLETSNKNITLDLDRTAFIGNENQERKQFVEQWQKASTLYYVKGQADSSVLTVALRAALENQCLKDVSTFSRDLADLATYQLEESRRKLEKSSLDLRFAYMDDQGQLCGFSLSYYGETKQWLVAITRNTDKEPENRSVTLFCSDDSVTLFDKFSPTNENNVPDGDCVEAIQAALKNTTVGALIPTLFEGASVLPQSMSQLVKSIKISNNNYSLVETARKGRLDQLTSSDLMTANLNHLLRSGFEITPLFDSQSAISAQNALFVCVYPKTGKKLVLFSPSTDCINPNVPQSQKHHQLLYTQDIARTFVNKGYTCIIPVVEYDNVSVAGINTGERKHNVVLLWSQAELKFFDPKSGKLGGSLPKLAGGYSNTVFKEFAKAASYMDYSGLLRYFAAPERNYTGIKEPHLQAALNTTNCGYYCVARVQALIDQFINQQADSIRSSGIIYTNKMSTTENALTDIQYSISHLINNSSLPPQIANLVTGTEPLKEPDSSCTSSTSSSLGMNH